jgi:hypothetical protein
VHGEEVEGILQMYEVPALVGSVCEQPVSQSRTDIIWSSGE